jgi:TRAP-type uncharacterized transport system fused permease subunit
MAKSNYMKYDIFYYIRLLIFAVVTAVLYFILVWSMSGCSVTSKHKSITKTSSDSIVSLNVDSSSFSRVDSTQTKKSTTETIKTTDGTFDKETIIEFGKDTCPSTHIPASDYFPPITKITIREKAVKHTAEKIIDTHNDSTQVIHNDTQAVHKEATTEVKKTALNKEKDVTKKSWWWLLWFLLIIPAYIVYINRGKITFAYKTLLGDNT